MPDLTISSFRGGVNNSDPSIAIDEDQCIQADNAITTKICALCQKEKLLSCFYFYEKEQRYWYRCRECHNKAGKRAWARLSPEERRQKSHKHKIKQTFGITLEEYSTMFDAQGGVC